MTLALIALVVFLGLIIASILIVIGGFAIMRFMMRQLGKFVHEIILVISTKRKNIDS